MGFFSFQPKHILCAIDFSELSHLALKYAAVGAREFGSKLTSYMQKHLSDPDILQVVKLTCLFRSL